MEAIEIDVANTESVTAARTAIGNKTDVLDVLINNAGITGGFPQAALLVKPKQFTAAFETNVIGVVRVTQAFIDLVKKSTEPRIVMVSSSQGSLTLADDPGSKYYQHKERCIDPQSRR